MNPLRLATWNVHGCVGTDLIDSPERIARVINQLAPDIIGLQELPEAAVARIAALTHMTAVAAVTRERGQRGNALLTRFELAVLARHDVSVGSHEPRGVLDVLVKVPGDEAARVLVTHFGLRAEERRRQADLLLELVRLPGSKLLVVMGDFNEWRPFARTLHRLDARLGLAEGVRSFPSYWPVFRLDRIWVSPHERLVEVRAWRGAEAWRASDHLPVVAVVGPSTGSG